MINDNGQCEEAELGNSNERPMDTIPNTVNRFCKSLLFSIQTAIQLASKNNK